MTARLADITARIEGIGQLGTVMSAMRGIAGARAQQARGQLAAVEHYAAGVTGAIGRVLSLISAGTGAAAPLRPALVIFCAEQGFAGAFSEHVLDAAGPELHTASLFLIGTRGLAAARERGLTPGWSSPLPAHSAGIPRLADDIAQALYQRIAAAGLNQIDALFSRVQPGQTITVERQRLLPFDLAAIPRAPPGGQPILNLAPEALLRGLLADYLHAQLCSAALHGFAAENQARMEAMAAAHQQVERQLESLRSAQRVVRQEEITAEIIELSAGEMASRKII
jgi:F-type H+-transporting ATPase subunit gamma